MHFLLKLFAQAAILSQAGTVLAAAVDNKTVLTKTLLTSDGYTYTYDYVPAANASRPTVMLLHGFPASRQDWENTIPALVAEGYGVVAPDLLGFGDTSKPTELEAYHLKGISDQLAEILDAEGLKQVVGVGHDIGANVLSRLVAWIPERFTKYVFVTVPYAPAGLLFDVDAINAQSLQTRGYTQFGYWYFFNSWDAADILTQRVESFFSLCWFANESAWGTSFAHIGAARTWLDANTTTELPSWVTPEYRDRWVRIYSQPNITISSTNYYKALLRGIHTAEEAAFTDNDRKFHVPVLAVASANDKVATPDLQKSSLEPWAVSGFEQLTVDSGHWMMQEKGDELNEILIEFIGRA